ncbi:hypothetical protein BL253_37670 [Pseudofrankia asymbiotica]|uniref:Uncharacterized protein n=2 Tax=Pseudofrankia asymbiotica TaxID=1834516 RepID=A0A1V2HZ90_9ACTN|nr:hypothetical protein BL253_37670 [Pseudofrankia asymbiotica]
MGLAAWVGPVVAVMFTAAVSSELSPPRRTSAVTSAPSRIPPRPLATPARISARRGRGAVRGGATGA